MSQCLRCSKPCEASAVFCEDCRSLLRNEFRQGSTLHSSDSGSADTSSAASSAQRISLATQEPGGLYSQDDVAHQSTMPLQIVQTPRSPGVASPITPHPPTLDDSYVYPDVAGQTMSRLSEAAQFISEVEPSNRRLPRASRLAPIRDISADIRRESTPLPKYAKMRTSAGTPGRVRTPGSLPTIKDGVPGREPVLDNDGLDLPDLWPWLDSEVEEKENEDTWANSTDPLISRHVPNSYDSARIEEEDIKRALAEGIPTHHDLRQIRPRRATSLRIVFAVLAMLAALALIADGVLLSVVVAHPRHATTVPNGPATAALMLTPDIVDVAKSQQQVQVHIMNFPPGHSVQLTHDIQEEVTTVDGPSLIAIGKSGSASVTIIADSTWATGYDQVFAEDTTTHYIAAAQLQVKSAEPSSPAHLAIVDQNGKSITSLNFGTGIQGSNLFQPLRLLNKGSGSITWSASSDQSWLIPSPNQGTFGRGQAIQVAAQLANLTAGKHSGIITIANNVGPSQTITATVNVTALPSNVGAVLAPTPAVLTFTTTDGGAVPPAQILTLNNPGRLPLNWTLSIASSASASNQLAFAHVQGTTTSWLSTDLTSGTVLAGANQQIQVSVNSNSLLPGAYQGQLMFNAPGAIDSPQTVSVSLTVQPHCGLVTNAGFLSFTAVQGETNPGNQSLGLNETASCAGAPIPWQATVSSSGWLSITPAKGTLRGTTSMFISVGANVLGYAATPRPYFGFISFTTQKSTQTVMVELIVQPPPAPGAPVMGATPLNLNFSNTSGQPNPKGQVVTITNTGGSALYWKTSVVIIGPTWLSASPTGGSVQPGQTGQVVINVDTSHLSPGTYAGQVTLEGMDSAGKPASGSGQIVAINLVVQPSCTLTQPSSSSLAFSGVQGGSNPISQSLLITGTGNCTWPLTLTASATSAPWLNVQFPPSGNTVKGSGQSVAFMVGVNMNGLMSGPPINASFTISALDSAGTVATGSPQQVTATLTVSPPCRPGAVSNLTFSAIQGQTSPAPLSVPLSESGTCSRPVTWTATADAGSSAWLSLSTPAPDTGSGTSLTVTANSSSLAAGTYTGTITLSAKDNNGGNVGSPLSITVSLTVTDSVSGTVMACQPGPAPLCTTSAALPGASLTLFNSSNVQVATATANASGLYIFSNLASGTYSVTITGTDANNAHYSTSGIPLVVTASASGVNLQVYPG